MDQDLTYREWRRKRQMNRRAALRRKLRLFDVTWLWIMQLVILGMIVSGSNSWYVLAICAIVLFFSTMMLMLFWAHYAETAEAAP